MHRSTAIFVMETMQLLYTCTTQSEAIHASTTERRTVPNCSLKNMCYSTSTALYNTACDKSYDNHFFD